jgi:hypothetical protein
MKKIIFAILLFFVAVFLLLQYYFSDIQINKYPDIDTVKEDQAIEKGWVPALLPDSAFNISETHDSDTNTLFGAFCYKEHDEKKLLSYLKHTPENNETYRWKDFLFKIDTQKNCVKYRNNHAL